MKKKLDEKEIKEVTGGAPGATKVKPTIGTVTGTTTDISIAVAGVAPKPKLEEANDIPGLEAIGPATIIK